MASLLVRGQSLFRPMGSYQPSFQKGYDWLLSIDPQSRRVFREKLQYDAPTTLGVCIPKPGSKSATADFTYFMAFPMVVTEGVANRHGNLAHGAISTITDICTSLHIAVALAPINLPHVSVTIQNTHLRKLRVGDEFVVLTTMDKIGKRLAYTSATYLTDVADPTAPTSSMSTQPITTFDELLQAVHAAPTIGMGKHVKCIVDLK